MARKQRNHSRRGPRQVDDAVGEWSGWLDHQYDPGYYTGGRIPPFMRRPEHAAHGRRPSRLGHVFIVTGAFTLLGTIAVAVAGGGLSLPSLVVVCGIGLLQLLCGWQVSRDVAPRPRRIRRRSAGR